jgi:acyl carrier protein
MNATEIIALAIAELNAESEGPDISTDRATPLLGDGGIVDSLALVNLVILIERVADEKAGKMIIVADESVFDPDRNPFDTVGSITDHVQRLLDAG